jgi:hypothetical protein
MKRGVTFLILWLGSIILLAGAFIPPIPPGGVTWPYYLFLACVPMGALRYAGYPGKARIAAGYGLIAGALFGFPIFSNERAVMAGQMTVEAVAVKIAVFALAMSLVCWGAFTFGRRWFRQGRVQAV